MLILVDRSLMRLLVALSTSLCLLLLLAFAPQARSATEAGTSLARYTAVMEYPADRGGIADANGGAGSLQEITGHDHSDHGHDKVVVDPDPSAVPFVSAAPQRRSVFFAHPASQPGGIDRPPRVRGA